MFTVDDSLKEFVESGVAVLVGTGDANGRPHIAMGWGPRVHEGGRKVDVFLDAERADPSLSDLEANGRIAVTFAHPVQYRSVQLKGRFVEARDADAADQSRVEQHRNDFLVSTTMIGDPAHVIQGLWLDQVVRVTFSVETAFDQTPGPEAGKPL